MAETVAAGNEKLIPEERPWYTEIDIMEFLGHEPTIVYGTLHYHSFDGQKKSSSGKTSGTMDYSRDFHVYAMEWYADRIDVYDTATFTKKAEISAQKPSGIFFTARATRIGQ